MKENFKNSRYVQLNLYLGAHEVLKADVQCITD